LAARELESRAVTADTRMRFDERGRMPAVGAFE
jgi:hypothetical protein